MKLHCKFEFQDGAGEVWEHLFNEGGTQYMYIVGLFSGTADFSRGQLASDPFHTISIFIKLCCESATKVHFAIQCSNLHCFLLFQANLPHNRLVILLCFSLLSVFGSNVAKFSGAGALGVLTMSTVAAYGWTNSGKVRAK